MYKITIKNYYRSGVLVKDETTLYHIPIQEGEKDNVLTDPSVSCDLGKTGTLEFTIYPNHPYYHAIAQMRTIMRVEYDGDTIFRGRILTVDNTMAGVKRIHCEGDMAFLLDSYQMGMKKELRSDTTLNAYITDILDEHNRQMMESGETDKCIYPGYVPGNYPSFISNMQQIPNETEPFGSDSTEQTMSALESLTKEFGGFFRTRYSDTDKKSYLDWCRLWFREDLENGQPVSITQNIIDAQSNSEVDNIFTALIPIGSNEGEDVFITGYRTDIHGDNNRILVPHIAQVYSADELDTGYTTKELYEKAVEQYGIIYKTQKFANADTPEKLWTYACDWIKNNYVGGITSYDLTAIDMHHVNKQVVKYLAGDLIELTIHSDMTELDEYNPDKQSNTVYRTLLNAKYDLHHPDKNSYTAGIPSDILNLEYGTKSTSKSSANGGGGGGKGAGGKGGGSNRKKQEEEEKRQAREKAQEALAWKLVWDETYNNTEYNALKNMVGGAAVKPALQTSQVIVKQIISNPEIDTKEEVFEQTAMVLNGQKRAATISASLAAPGMASTLQKFMKMNPTGRKLLEMDEGYQRTVSSIAINAGLKQVGVSGKNKTALDNILDQAVGLGITADTPLDTATSMIKNITDNVTPPNIVASFGSVADANGNESGLIEAGKEAVTNLVMNGGGNGGTGTVNVGKESAATDWLIQMNQPLQWKDSQGTVHTLPSGTINAKDYSSLKEASGNPIPSFTTQVGVFKEAIASNLSAINATIEDLSATKATVRTLNATIANIDNLIATKVDAKFSSTSGFTAYYGSIKNLAITEDATFRGKSISWIYSSSDRKYYLGRNAS